MYKRNEPLFKLENEELFYHSCLIDMNNIPLFFICKNLKQDYYICLCYEFEHDLKYIVVPTTRDLIKKCINSKITMRNLLLNSSSIFYNVINDVVTKNFIENIDKSILPYRDAFFKTNSMKFKI